MSDTTGERTERASPRKLREARQKGSIGTSRDLGSWLGIGAGALTLVTVGKATADVAGALLLHVPDVIRNPDPAVAVALGAKAIDDVIPSLAPLFAAVMVAGVAAVAVQGGIHLRRPEASFRNFDLMAGLKRTFGMQALWEGGKALLKTAAISLVLFGVLQGLIPVLMATGRMPLTAILDIAGQGVSGVFQAAIGVGLALAIADIVVVVRRNRKHTFVTKKEARDEHKNTEGDPHVKGQRRSRQMAMSRNRMISAVSVADVVLLNPTHLAIALKYEPGRSAPRVVAKGADHLATRIREKATTSGVPMVEDIPLARAIYAACDLGQEIPVELYAPVARLLAFVASLTRRGSARGVHRPLRSFQAA